jgi:hypothetical protein
MPTPVSCPRCGSNLDVPDELMAGPVRCANCATVFNPPQVPGAVSTVHPSDRPRKKSRSGCLWGLLAVGLFCVFGCCGTCVALFQYIENPTLKPYTAPDQTYSVSFPDTPSPVDKFGPAGKKVSGVEATRVFPKERFFVEYSTVTKAEAFDDPKKLLAALCDAWVKSISGGKELKRYAHEVDGYPAIDLFVDTGQFGQNSLYVRVIKVGDRLYSVGVEGQIRPEHKHGDDFLDTFHPAEKGK